MAAKPRPDDVGDVGKEESAAPPTAAASDADICIICGRRETDGLRIAEEFICSACEREMVHTEVWDAKYPFFIHRMKQMWRQKDA